MDYVRLPLYLLVLAFYVEHAAAIINLRISHAKNMRIYFQYIPIKQLSNDRHNNSWHTIGILGNRHREYCSFTAERYSRAAVSITVNCESILANQYYRSDIGSRRSWFSHYLFCFPSSTSVLEILYSLYGKWMWCAFFINKNIDICTICIAAVHIDATIQWFVCCFGSSFVLYALSIAA